MSWICKDLKEQVQILYPIQEPNDDNGSLDLLLGDDLDNLTPLKTVWMGFKPASFQGRGSQYVRGEQINENITHNFKARRVAIDDLGNSFTLAFSSGFKFMPDLMGLKSNYFLFVERGSSVKGRLFRIHTITDHKENREFLNIGAEEIESRGDGYGT